MWSGCRRQRSQPSRKPSGNSGGRLHPIRLHRYARLPIGRRSGWDSLRESRPWRLAASGRENRYGQTSATELDKQMNEFTTQGISENRAIQYQAVFDAAASNAGLSGCAFNMTAIQTSSFEVTLNTPAGEVFSEEILY